MDNVRSSMLPPTKSRLVTENHICAAFFPLEGTGFLLLIAIRCFFHDNCYSAWKLCLHTFQVFELVMDRFAVRSSSSAPVRMTDEGMNARQDSDETRTVPYDR